MKIILKYQVDCDGLYSEEQLLAIEADSLEAVYCNFRDALTAACRVSQNSWGKFRFDLYEFDIRDFIHVTKKSSHRDYFKARDAMNNGDSDYVRMISGDIALISMPEFITLDTWFKRKREHAVIFSASRKT